MLYWFGFFSQEMSGNPVAVQYHLCGLLSSLPFVNDS